MNPIKITFIGDLDLNQPRAEIRSFKAELTGLRTGGNQAAVSPSQLLGFSVEDVKKTFADVGELTGRQAQLARISYQTTAKYAQEAARQTTIYKASEVRQTELAERGKQKAVEISARAQLQAQKQTFQSAELLKNREYQEFVRLEREKTRASRKPSGLSGNDVFGAVFGASTAAGLTVNAISSSVSAVTGAVSSLVGATKDLAAESITLAGNFQVTTSALAVFTGSAQLAKEELEDIEALAKNTPGLRLVSAQEGYQQLRALGFQASIAKGFIKELGEEKILSGASDEALNRISTLR